MATDINEALRRFEARWSTLPPLVRAGAGHFLVLNRSDAARAFREDANNAAALGLDRRASVMERFALAAETIGELFADLTRAADSEAEARGIDADMAGNALAGSEP